MSKLKTALVSLLLVTAAGFSFAADDKIVVLDVQAAILNTDVAQERLKALREEADFKSNMKEVEQLQKEHNDLVAKLKKDSAVMSQEEIQNQTQKIQEKRADIEHVARKLQASEKQVAQQVVQELAPKLQDVVNKMIKEDGIGMIIRAEATLHATNAFNITAKVTDKLNQAK